MNFESPELNNDALGQQTSPEENLEEALNTNVEVIETGLSPEDFEKLDYLRQKIQLTEGSSAEIAERFELAKEEFIQKIDDSFEEGEWKQIAAVCFLRNVDIDEATEFDFSDGYSVMEFVESFDK